MSNFANNNFKIRDCKVVLEDFRYKIITVIREKIENVKHEPEKYFEIFLPQKGKKLEKDATEKSKFTPKSTKVTEIDLEESDIDGESAKSKEEKNKATQKSRIETEKVGNKLKRTRKLGSNPKKTRKPRTKSKKSHSAPSSSKCRFCNETFSSYSVTYRHYCKHHHEKLLKCDICGQLLCNKMFMEAHMRKKHADGKIRKYFCDFCGKIFHSKGKLYYHMHCHMMLVKCHLCEAKLKPTSLKEHLKDFHAKYEIKCKICPKKFKAKKDLTRHMKVHDKKFSCKMCPKKFRLTYELNKHVEFFHDNPKSFKCETCGMTFNERICLTRHKRRHEMGQKRNIKCPKCNYETFDKQLYQRHLDRHAKYEAKTKTMENPKICATCGEGYETRKLLKRHIDARHKAPQKLICDLCGESCKFKRDMTKHMKHHKMMILKNLIDS